MAKKGLLVLALCAPLGAVALVFSGTAAADATVNLSNGELQITVAPKSGADGDHSLTVQRFLSDALIGGGDGMRVQALASGQPPLSSSSCNKDFFSNSVLCNASIGAASISMGDGADSVTLSDPVENFSGGGSEPACIAGGASPTPVTVGLGSGNDSFFDFVSTGLCPLGTMLGPVPHFNADFQPIDTVSGGPGDDAIHAGSNNDTLNGDDGNDSLVGNDGNDTLNGGAGNDNLLGSDGNDTLAGGLNDDVVDGSNGDDTFTDSQGNDTYTGGPGNDTFLAASNSKIGDADSYSGGPGFDTVSYAGRADAVDVRINNVADDGGTGEGDNVKTDVEEVVGGNGGDSIIGNPATTTSETLIGGPGDDLVVGGGGADNLQGGDGNDGINGIDGIADQVSCGDGTDSAVLDLKDILKLVPVRVGVVFFVSDCESVTRQAVDDSPPGRPLQRAIRLRGRHARLRFACPRSAKPSCHGKLRLADPYRPAKVLARSTYALRLGQTAWLRLRLTKAGAALLRRRGRGLVETVEHGHSKIGPRGSRFVLPVRR